MSNQPTTPKPEASKSPKDGSDLSAASCSRLESPADVCLKSSISWVAFDPTADVVDLSDNEHQIQVKVEHRAWVCPFCNQSTEYWVVNGKVVLGLGGYTRMENGRISNCCERWQCRKVQDKFHENVKGIPDGEQAKILQLAYASDQDGGSVLASPPCSALVWSSSSTR